MHIHDLDTMTHAYLACALWAGTDDDGTPLDRRFSLSDITEQAIATARLECFDFFTANWSDLKDLTPDQAGHDFYLTRNHHGAGFWDRDLGDVGERLTEAAHAFGERDIFIGDDGKLWLCYG